MKIALVNGSGNDAVESVLANDANNRAVTRSVDSAAWGGPEVDAAEVEFAVQTSRPIGANHATHYGRGNASGTLRFSATTQCGQYPATGTVQKTALAVASELAATWPDNITLSGTLTIDGNSLGPAKVQSVKTTRIGVTVRADYVILYETGRS